MKTRLFLCFTLIFLIFSCKTSNISQKGNNGISGKIVNTSWKLTEISGGKSDISQSSLDIPLTIEFTDSGVNGKSTVNSYFSSYNISGNSIFFEGIASTRMGGPENLMKMEHEYFDILNNVKNIELPDNNTLILKTGKEILKFKKN